MEFSIDMPESGGIVETTSGAKFYLSDLLRAICEFNGKCPKKGGLIMRDHIGHFKETTHITNCLRYESGKLVANIELLASGLEGARIKPIIQIPLRFGSGIQIERVLGIVNIYLED